MISQSSSENCYDIEEKVDSEDVRSRQNRVTAAAESSRFIAPWPGNPYGTG